MKNLIGIVILGGFLYVVMGGSTPSFTHHLGEDHVMYDDKTVDTDDVFVGIHVVHNDDGSRSIEGVSHWGELLSHSLWSGFLRRNEAVQRSYVAQTEKQRQAIATLSTQEQLETDSCGVSFMDVDAADAAGLLGDLCIVGGMGHDKFYPNNHIRRGSVAKIVVGALLYRDTGSSLVSEYTGAPLYDDVPSSAEDYVAELHRRGLLGSIARDAQVFGVDDIMTPGEITSFLEQAAGLASDDMLSGKLGAVDSTDYVARGDFARVVVDIFSLHNTTQTSVLALR